MVQTICLVFIIRCILILWVHRHEHLYQEIVDNLIRTDDLSQTRSAYETERFVLGSSIMLCTLSTLSNPVLEQCHMFKVVPMEKLIVDEASQINMFDYMVCFTPKSGKLDADLGYAPASIPQVQGFRESMLFW